MPKHTDLPIVPRTALCIHGVANDQRVWGSQVAALQAAGWQVATPNLPGHSATPGDAPNTVERAASAMLALIQASPPGRFALIGHSWGSLIALEVAARAPEYVSHLVLIGTAAPMRVSPALMEAALLDPLQALALIDQYTHSKYPLAPDEEEPERGAHGALLALSQAVQASNTQANLCHRGLQACAHYTEWLQAIASVQCPVLFVLGDGDQMTPPKSAQALIDSAPYATVAQLRSGHNPMHDAPRALSQAITAFLR